MTDDDGPDMDMGGAGAPFGAGATRAAQSSPTAAGAAREDGLEVSALLLPQDRACSSTISLGNLLRLFTCVEAVDKPACRRHRLWL
jgi:hypothetical protein